MAAPRRLSSSVCVRNLAAHRNAMAVDVAAAVDERMKKSMLRLYRSATNLGGEWHEGVDGITRPGLVLWGRDDPFAAVGFAELLVFDNCGHWWPSQRPVEAAQALERFWATRA
jgi:pimeloyl-ACP methyl ester carboxylesterase